MIVPQFLRFYQGYTADGVMSEYAITFFALVNSMYRIKADESLDRITEISVPNMDRQDSSKVIDGLKQSSKGISGIVEQVRIAKR